MRDWLPVWCLLSQAIVWGMIIPQIVSSHTMAILTFTQDPNDPDF